MQEVGGAPGASDGSLPGSVQEKGRPGSKLPVGLQKRISEDVEDLLMKDFAEFDTKGTGTVSLDQYIRAMMQLHGDGEEASLVASFQEMDADCDGYISLTEVSRPQPPSSRVPLCARRHHHVASTSLPRPWRCIMSFVSGWHAGYPLLTLCLWPACVCPARAIFARPPQFAENWINDHEAELALET